jgi:hypothetical protein
MKGCTVPGKRIEVSERLSANNTDLVRPRGDLGVRSRLARTVFIFCVSSSFLDVTAYSLSLLYLESLVATVTYCDIKSRTTLLQLI